MAATTSAGRRASLGEALAPRIGSQWLPALRAGGVEVAIPAAIALGAGVLYLREASPAVGGGNSGEFQVMAHLMGIAHPPSYPLYLLLAKAASLLPLPGDVAWRVNVLTAVLGALSVFLAGLLPLVALGAAPRPARLLAGVVAAAATSAMPRLWSLSLEAEVFTLHLALVVAFWLALARWQAVPGDDRPLLAASVLAGLGLANHRTFLFVAAGGLLFVLFGGRRLLRRWRLVLACLALAGAGLSPYLYVLRGLVTPVAYFSPGDVHRLSPAEVWYVLQGNAAGETAGGLVVVRLLADRALLFDRSAWLWQHLAGQFGPAGGALAAAGVAGLLAATVRRPAWCGSATAGALGAALFAMSYAKYPDADRYLLPLEVLLAFGLAVLAAAAVGPLERVVRLARPCRRAVATQVAAAALALTLAGYSASSLAALAGATTFTRGGYVHHTVHNLQGVAPDAVVCSWWASAWGWWYAQYVDGYRPDVTLIPKGPDDCARDVVPNELGRRPVYLPAMTAGTRESPFAFFPSRDLWTVVGRRAPLRAGSLLKGPDERIYLYDGERRRWIASMGVFERHGFAWERVALTPDYVLRDIPEGPPLDG